MERCAGNSEGYGISNGYQVQNISRALIENILQSSPVIAKEFSHHFFKRRVSE
jgi:hypothetical protein